MKYSLKLWNTFGVNHYANNIVYAENSDQILSTWKSTTKNQQPVLVLGEGSNVLFLEDFAGTVIINRITGIKISEDDSFWYLHIGAGENWHKIVQFTIENNMPGLENLAFIPGCVGSSPIQNIGAHGVEFKNVCRYINFIDLKTGNYQCLEAKLCKFGYRDSIFRHKEYRGRFVIIAVGIKLPKIWKPKLTYGGLNLFNPLKVTPKQIFNYIYHVRMNSLPDPKINGNAGSFFKNPIIKRDIAQKIIDRWPNIPYYKQSDDNYVKLAASWLIDRCYLRGLSYGGAEIYNRQPLVIINKKNATSEDIISLARIVYHRVSEKFNVYLEPEVQFIGIKGEIEAAEALF